MMLDKIKEKLTYSDKMMALYAVLSVAVSRIIMYIVYYFGADAPSPADFLITSNQLDAKWYYKIATEGYNIIPRDPSGYIELPFFPLYPRLVGFLSLIHPGEKYVYFFAFLLGNIFLLISFYYAFKYVKLRGAFDTKEYMIYVYLMCFGLFTFYMTLFYTEAPFIAFLCACFYYLEKKDYIKMGVAGLLLSFTRNTGVFFCFVVLVKLICDYIENHDSGTDGKKSIAGFLQKVFTDSKLVLGTILIPFGVFAHMLYLQITVGDGLAFVHTQYAWNRDNVGVIRVLFESLKEFNIWGYWALGAILLLLILIFKQKEYAEATFAAFVLLIPLLSSTMSIGRFAAGCFVIKYALSRELAKANRAVRIFVLIVAFVYELILFNAFIHGDWKVQ